MGFGRLIRVRAYRADPEATIYVVAEQEVVRLTPVEPPRSRGRKEHSASRRLSMAEELDFSNPEHAAGSTMAAFALAQMSFSTLVTNELISKALAEKMLKQLIKANETGGTAHQVAAALFSMVLQNVSAFQPATRQ